MGQWIEQAEDLGIRSHDAIQQTLEVEAAAREKFKTEEVTEEKVRFFLDKFLEPMRIVREELRAKKYSIFDDGYSYSRTPFPEAKRFYALGNEHRKRGGGGFVGSAYGRVYIISLPNGAMVDKVRLFSTVNNETHFAGVQYSLQFGGIALMDSPADVMSATSDLREIIGNRILKYFEVRPGLKAEMDSVRAKAA